MFLVVAFCSISSASQYWRVLVRLANKITLASYVTITLIHINVQNLISPVRDLHSYLPIIKRVHYYYVNLRGDFALSCCDACDIVIITPPVPSWGVSVCIGRYGRLTTAVRAAAVEGTSCVISALGCLQRAILDRSAQYEKSVLPHKGIYVVPHSRAWYFVGCAEPIRCRAPWDRARGGLPVQHPSFACSGCRCPPRAEPDKSRIANCKERKAQAA